MVEKQFELNRHILHSRNVYNKQSSFLLICIGLGVKEEWEEG